MLDVGYDEQQRSYAQAIASFCAKHAEVWAAPSSASELSPALWTGLGELGVLGLTSAASGAEPLDVVAAHEALGAGGCPGPLWQTALAVGVLAGDDLDAVSAGSLIVTVGPLGRMPWARRADLVLDDTELRPDGGTLRRCESIEFGRDTTLIGFEPATSIQCTHGESLAVSSSAKALAELALAAYLVGAAHHVIAGVATYVRSRRQFRRMLSEFQAVAHPLAECDARVAAAAALVRRAASRITTEPSALVDTSIALASAARAARQAVYQAHQAYGGIGFAEEGPLAWIGSRVAQLSTEAEALCRARPVSDLLADV
jgi:alkylation response protein AidB-like acyl-CoA dehydrogenase